MDKRPEYNTVIPPKVLKDRIIGNLAKLVYGEIGGATDNNGRCELRDVQMGEWLNKSHRAIHRAILNLHKAGYVEVGLTAKGNRFLKPLVRPYRWDQV